MSQLIAEEDARVFQKKRLVCKFLMADTEERSGQENLMKVGRQCEGVCQSGKELGYGEQTEKKQALSEGENEIQAAVHSGEAVESLTKLNKLMVETLKLQAAPKVDIDTFSGDPLKYTYFIETFKDVVESLVSNPKQRLVRLLKYTEGEAKELIQHCVHEEPDICYSSALQLLENEYGSPFRITCAYLEKLKTYCCLNKCVPGTCVP